MSDTRRGRIFDLMIQVLIVISLIDFTISIIPGLPPMVEEALTVMEFIVVVVFSAEYLLRLVLAEKWYRSAFGFEGIGFIGSLAILFSHCGPAHLRRLAALSASAVSSAPTLWTDAAADWWGFSDPNRDCFLRDADHGAPLPLSGIYYCEREAQPGRSLEAFRDCL